MTEQEYKDYGLPTDEEISENAKFDKGLARNLIFIDAATWMRGKAVEAIDKLNEDNMAALKDMLSQKRKQSLYVTLERADGGKLTVRKACISMVTEEGLMDDVRCLVKVDDYVWSITQESMIRLLKELYD